MTPTPPRFPDDVHERLRRDIREAFARELIQSAAPSVPVFTGEELSAVKHASRFYKDEAADIANYINSRLAQAGFHPAPSFQQQVAPWMQECFGAEISSNITERCDRFIEEAFELVQSLGYPKKRAHTLLHDYVYKRPVGKADQEVGGVMVTLAALCLATDMDMHAAGNTELARVWTKIDKIRQKQKSKRDIHSPLPVDEPATEKLTEAQEEKLKEVFAAREFIERKATL